MKIAINPKPWDHSIQWRNEKFHIFIGAGGLPNDSGWDVRLSSGFSCSYETTNPQAVQRLINEGYSITQEAANKLHEQDPKTKKK